MALTKKVMGAVAAIALVLTTLLTFAFKPLTNSNKKVAPQTWYYKLTSTSASDINNPSNYQSTPLPDTECGSGSVVCNIVDEPNSSNSNIPALSQGNVTTHLEEYDTSFKDVE